MGISKILRRKQPITASGNDFSDLTPKEEMKPRMAKTAPSWKTESGGGNQSNETQTMEWKKIFANRIPNKGSIPRNYKATHNSTRAKPRANQFANEQMCIFFSRKTQIASKQMGRRSTLLTTRGMQIKTTVTYHLRHVGW